MTPQEIRKRFERGLRQGKYPGGLYIAAEAEGQSAVYKVYALPQALAEDLADKFRAMEVKRL